MATKAEKGRVSIMTKQQKKTLNLVLTYLVIILIGCVLLFPIAWMISAAFKTNDEIFGSIALLPKSFSFQNFIDGWKSAGIYTYAKCSLQGTTQSRYLTGGVPPVRFSM